MKLAQNAGLGSLADESLKVASLVSGMVASVPEHSDEQQPADDMPEFLAEGDQMLPGLGADTARSLGSSDGVKF